MHRWSNGGMDYVFGYTCGVDVSARAQWGLNPFLGTNHQGIGPLQDGETTKIDRESE